MAEYDIQPTPPIFFFHTSWSCASTKSEISREKLTHTIVGITVDQTTSFVCVCVV